jgi:SH3-like domain-containing protein
MQRRTMAAAGLVGLVAVGLVALALTRSHAPAGPAPRVTPSGLPVPRYVSLKFDSVNARAGPGDDHRLLFVFHARGLPLQVVAETSDWRRVCDPDGGLSWVHRRTTDGRRMVMGITPRPTAMRDAAKADAPIAAYLAPRALAEFARCKLGWCQIRVGRVGGWIPASALWGVSDQAQCR